jgi:hypothetical protein
MRGSADGSAGDADYGRSEGLLEEGVRRADSAWSLIDPAVALRFEEHLRRDLDPGAWEARHGHLRTQPSFDGSLRLLVALP